MSSLAAEAKENRSAAPLDGSLRRERLPATGLPDTGPSDPLDAREGEQLKGERSSKKYNQLIFVSDLSDEARKEIIASSEGIPEAEYVSSQGVTFNYGRMPADLEVMRQMVLVPSDEDPRNHFNQVGGIYDTATKRVEIPEYVLNHKNRFVPQGDLGAVNRHETFHGFNHNGFDNSDLIAAGLPPEPKPFPRVSDNPSFIESYNADVDDLGGPEKASEAGFSYFIRSDLRDGGARGRDELIGEQWSDIRGGGVNPRVPQAFPRTNVWGMDYLQGHEEARERGPQEVRAFYTHFGESRLSYVATLEAITQAVKRLRDFSRQLVASPGIVVANAYDHHRDAAEFCDAIKRDESKEIVDRLMESILSDRPLIDAARQGEDDFASYLEKNPGSEMDLRRKLSAVTPQDLRHIKSLGYGAYTEFDQRGRYDRLTPFERDIILEADSQKIKDGDRRKLEHLEAESFAKYYQTEPQMRDLMQLYKRVMQSRDYSETPPLDEPKKDWSRTFSYEEEKPGNLLTSHPRRYAGLEIVTPQVTRPSHLTTIDAAPAPRL